MQVDESGHDGLATHVDDACIRGNGDASGGANRDDALALDDDVGVGDDLVTAHRDHAPTAQHDDTDSSRARHADGQRHGARV